MAAAETDIAAKLIERLLADPAFRDRFRRNPALACREAGLESLADEMQLSAGKAMQTLDIRESRSSLAGVMMAAAMEGMGVYEFSKHVVPHLEDLSGSLGDVLSRVNLPALPGRGALSGGPAASSAAAIAPAAEEADADAGGGGNGAAGAAAPAAAAEAPAKQAKAPEEAAAKKAKPPEAPEVAAAKGKQPAARAGAAPEPAAANGKPPPERADAAPADAPGPSELPDGPVEPKASKGGPEAGGKVAAQPAAAPAAAAPAAAPQASSPSAPVDPSTLGQDGTGGTANAEGLALLENKNVVLDDVGVADIKAGKIDPRIVGVLTKLSQEHKIVVSCMCSDHSKFTAGGSISNHAFGRGLDIASIDGEIVSPGSALAREVASELSELDTAIRPDEIGSPFAINGPGYFTDAAHSNHIHVGFKQAITPEFKLPPELAAGAPAAAVAAAGAAAPELVAAAAGPGAQLSAAPAGDPKRASGLFAAVPQPAKAAAAALKAAQGGKDSQLFLQAVRPAEQPGRTADVQPQPAAPAVDLSGAPGAYPGDDAPKEQIAAWMAAEAKKRGLPPQLPVMAALVESNLTNVDFGDADSLGYFQMRVSIWERDYPGFATDPNKQIDWFLDTAEGVKAQRVARGQSIDDPSQFGEWIADVERPAEQYRGRYQLKLADANGLLANAPAAPEVAAAQPGPAPAPAAAREPIDPDQFGQDGTGGKPDAESLALLKNENVVLDDVGVADIKAGRIDPRIVAVLTKLSQEHKIVVSCMCSDHSRLTSGGSVSNHTFGRGLDIASIDGEIVSPSSALAREVASELSQFDPSIRPSEIGSPFAINGPAYFTDAAHSNHIHVGFDQEVAPDFVPPAELAAGAQPAAAAPGAVAAAGPGTPLAPAPPSDPKRASGLFAAIPKPAKAAAADLAAAQKPRGDSGLFGAIGADPAPQPGRAAAAEVAAPAPAVDLSGAPGAYPGDDAPKEQIAAWMAAEAKKRGLPPQLPVMAALVESNLTNVDFGDADSLGYFQMRVSIWDQGEYAGFAKDPDKQIDWFLDTAERVKEQRIARGQAIDDPSQFGEWIADVERPAEQYRGRYQLKLADANGLLANAPAAPPPAAPELAAIAPAASGGEPAAADAVADAAPPAVAQGPGPKALAALEEAKKHTGTPYKWGGSTPQTGFDCSGLVQWAYAQAGVKIPRVTDQQIAATNGGAVRRDELLPGDLVFFRDPSGYVHHVGISMGGDKFLHAPRTGDVVKVSSLNEPYYKSQFTGGRRFDEPATAGPAVAPVAPAAAPVIDPLAVAAAQAAVARDAAEVRQPSSGLFKAIAAQEARNHADSGDRAVASATGEAAKRRSDSAMFLAAITPEQAAADAAAAAPPAPAPPVTPSVPAVPASDAVAPAPPAEAPIPDGPPPDLSDVPADYPGDDAGQEALAKWLAKEAERAGLPPELPVMAALVESGVKNLNFGDADSVGFFQMRVGIWNRGRYAGYPDNPGLQIKWFIDTAVAHKKAQIAQGDGDFGKDPRTWGEWIADVERPAEQYRGRYQTRLAEARRLLR